MDTTEFRKLILDKLREGIVVFHYRKKNGTLRKAQGTLNMALIPTEHHPKGTGRQPKDDIIPYFDIERNHWRSFRLHRVTSFYPQPSDHEERHS